MDLKKAEHFAIRDLFTGLTVHSISSDLTMTALQTTFPPQEYSIETIGQGLREVLAQFNRGMFCIKAGFAMSDISDGLSYYSSKGCDMDIYVMYTIKFNYIKQDNKTR